MNRRLQSYIDQMQLLAGELAHTLERLEEHLQHAQEDKEEHLRQYWSAKREINALRETIERIPDLETENKDLKEKNRASLEHAKRILSYTTALSGAIEE